MGYLGGTGSFTSAAAYLEIAHDCITKMLTEDRRELWKLFTKDMDIDDTKKKVEE